MLDRNTVRTKVGEIDDEFVQHAQCPVVHSGKRAAAHASAEQHSNVVHYRQLPIHGANGFASEHNKRALEYISTGRVPVKDLITHHISLEKVLDAFSIVENGEAMKVTVEP